jgi:UPF0271 protein
MKLTTIDLNADLGETVNDYLDLLPIITSANVACGAHAGGGELLKETVRACVASGVQVGAHPSYPDRDNFGRISMKNDFSKEELTELISNQIELVLTELKHNGSALTHVKAHGALYNDAVVDVAVAEALVEAVKVYGVPVFGLPNSALETVAKKHGLAFIPEGYMDRAYTSLGTLVPRTIPGAVLSHDQALTQIAELAVSGTIQSIDGVVLDLNLQTLCIHADTPDAATTAQAVKAIFEANDIVISSFKVAQ